MTDFMPTQSAGSISFSKESIIKLNNLANSIDKYPNRIERAMVTAAHAAERDVRREIAKKFGRELADDEVIEITIKNTKTRLTMKTRVLYATGHNRDSSTFGPKTKARMKANILLTGRRRYTARRSPGRAPYDLTRRHTGLNKAAYGFTVKRQNSNYEFNRILRRSATKYFRENFSKSLRREGFGVRGGSGGISADI